MVLNELSAHADREDLLNYAANIKGLNTLFLVHTETPQVEAFAQIARQSLPSVTVNIPEFSQSFELWFLNWPPGPTMLCLCYIYAIFKHNIFGVIARRQKNLISKF